MPINLGIEHILIFCIVQTLLLIGILMQKRFHQIPNLFLGVIFGMLTFIYGMYLLEHLHLLDSKPGFKAVKRMVEQFPQAVIYIYMKLLINGLERPEGIDKRYAIAPLMAVIAIVPLLIHDLSPFLTIGQQALYFQSYMAIGAAVAGLQFYIYGIKIIRLIQQKTRSRGGLWKCLISVKEKRYRWARLMAITYFIHGSIFGFECVFFIVSPEAYLTPMLVNTLFYITLGYLLMINIIQNPTIIHFSRKTAGRLVLKKYEKSGLTMEEAKTHMARMNSYMESEKPYLDHNLSIQDLSDQLGIMVHTISEVTNGLMGQNFFDYVNNYRIEEFKRLAVDPDHNAEKILNLAFASGFSSKTSFNIAFKKFTGETPSRFMKRINNRMGNLQ